MNYLAASNAAQSFDAYLQYINKIPMLKAEEEHQLAVRLRKDNDLNSAQALILPHLKFVVHIAKGYMGYGLALSDLVQEGNIGLMKAVKKFDPDHGTRLVSFAVHWIKSEIHEFVIRNWRIVKIATTKAQRKLFFNLRSFKKRLGWFSTEDINMVAESLNVKPETVLEMEKRLNGQDITYDPPNTDDHNDHEEFNSPANMLPDHRFDPGLLLENSDHDHHQQQKLTQALASLDDRGRQIIDARWLADGKSTLHELASQFDVSAERIRQIEKKAFQQLKSAYLSEA